MKRSLLSLGAALLLSAGVFAQTPAIDPTSSELSGNDVTTNGYAFNFSKPTGENDASTANCMASTGIMNEGAVTAYGISYNTDSIYAVISFDGKQSNGFGSEKNSGDGFLWNRFPSGNCVPATIDVKSGTLKIKAKVKSSVAIPEFYIGVVVNQSDVAVLADANLGPANAKTLVADTWTEVEFDIATKGWFDGGSNTVDLDKTIGLFFTVRDKAGATDATTPTGEIAIDWITVGDANGTELADRITALTESEIAALNVTLFPNPASDVLNVTYNVPADESVVVTLSNSLGQEVASVEGSTSSASIDVAGLNGGLYFASVIVDGVVVATQKVIVD